MFHLYLAVPEVLAEPEVQVVLAEPEVLAVLVVQVARLVRRGGTAPTWPAP